METQGPLFRRGVPTLQTSLTLPELPCTATAILVCENVSRFFGGGCRTGKFFVGLGGRILSRCAASRVIGEGKAFRMLIVIEMTRWVSCCIRDRKWSLIETLWLSYARLCVSAEIPPAGAPSGFDSAAGRGGIAYLFACSAAPLRMTKWANCCVGGTILVN